MIRDKENLWGARAFLIGVTLSLLIGILSSLVGESIGQFGGIFLAALVILGFVVGLTNISPKDVNTFLMAAVSLVIVSFAGASGIKDIVFLNIAIGNIVSATLGALLVMLVPATIVVAIKSLFSISQV